MEEKKLSPEDLKEYQEATMALAKAQSSMAIAQGKLNELLVSYRIKYGFGSGEVPDVGTGEAVRGAARPVPQVPTRNQ